MAVHRLGDDRPDLPDGGRYWIADNATVLGKVRLGAEASVWFGAVLRGDNEAIDIGPRTNIQDLCVIHTDPGFPATVGAGCTIGHRAILHGCTIGDNTLVGMGAIVMNGSTVGSNCVIGAGALIGEGKTIPDNSLVVGMPGKVIRTLDEASAAQVAEAADIYVRKWKRYVSDFD
ncbi:MAG TPA: gamma carbonic anhydrase family protein [Afifellaceae bacterium]|nr:gamma carbonic anhydrase family protein [Afifellaceae bacterium]